MGFEVLYETIGQNLNKLGTWGEVQKLYKPYEDIAAKKRSMDDFCDHCGNEVYTYWSQNWIIF